MKRFIILTLIFFALSAFAVFAFSPEGWTDEDVKLFSERFGGDIEDFFEVGNTEGFDKEKVIEFYTSHPGVIAEGLEVNENGELVKAGDKQDIQEEEKPADGKIHIEIEQEDTEEPGIEKPMWWLAGLVVLIFAGAVAGLVIANKKEKHI